MIFKNQFEHTGLRTEEGLGMSYMQGISCQFSRRGKPVVHSIGFALEMQDFTSWNFPTLNILSVSWEHFPFPGNVASVCFCVL